MYSPLVQLDDELQYRELYNKIYCKETIYTYDGYVVSFSPKTFDHAFFSSSNRRVRDKSIFNTERATRILWIKKVLEDATLTLYAGWDTTRKKYDASRRVCLVTDDGYVVVLRKASKIKFIFVTAYVIDSDEVKQKIMASPIWSHNT
ncbi:hypothetical protein ACFOQM_12760 [Paenibacillus sp. GCM10012307]|uniref:Uncharacterized protein n=1 Tax=Paenibacillus roseus TaxID=2798579 RepID=A0A934J5N2_9BACL|nr:hypothetical protein [Paenibacillus roseus]MBJ6362164.1 hypothetical protein [Paenibacillus roseus]